MMRLLRSALLCATTVAVIPGLSAQPAAQAQESETPEPPAGVRPWSIGFRFRGFASPAFEDGKLEQSITTPPTSWIFTTTSNSPAYRIGPAADFLLNKKVTLRIELLFQRPSYTQVTETYAGVDKSDTTTDERTKTTTTERSKVSYWEVPVLASYQSIRARGILSKMYLSGGFAIRSAAHVRSARETVFADSSTAYNEKPAVPTKRNLLGGVVGVGFRFVDDYNIKVTPQIRYTRWNGFTFASESTRSSKGQLDIGVAFTF